MKLIINGKEKEFNSDISLIQIMKKLKIENQIGAIAVNMEVLIKDKWDTFTPKENDKIEFLQFVGVG